MLLICKNGLWRIYDTNVFGVHINAVFTCIWYQNCCRAYDTQFSRTYDMHLPHNPNPTHRVAYTNQSQFLRINTTSFHFYLAYNLYALSWDRVGHICFTVLKCTVLSVHWKTEGVLSSIEVCESTAVSCSQNVSLRWRGSDLSTAVWCSQHASHTLRGERVYLFISLSLSLSLYTQLPPGTILNNNKDCKN